MKLKINIGSGRIDVNEQDILIFMFVSVLLFTRTIQMDAIIANMLVALIGCCCLIFVLNDKKMKDIKLGLFPVASKLVIEARAYMVFICMFLMILMALSISFNHNQNYYDCLWITSYIGVAAVLYFSDVSEKIIITMYYMICVYFIVFIILGYAPGDVLVIGSENNISVYILLVLYMLVLPRQYDRKPVSLIPILIAALIIIWTASRAGLLSILFLILLICVYNIVFIKRITTKLLIGYTISIIAVVLVFCFYFEYLFGDIIEKINNYGATSIRTEIWKEYFFAIIEEPTAFIFGGTTGEIGRWLSFYGGNLHNSFLSLHAHFGLVGFIVMLIAIFKAFIKACSNNNYILPIILISASIRCCFDWIAFAGVFDILYYYALFYVVDSNKLMFND